MKRIFVFMMAAIVAAVSMSAVMAAQSSTFTVDPNGTYIGTCYDVDMNGESEPDVTNVSFVVKQESGDTYRFDGTVYIEVDVPIGHVEHWITFQSMFFDVDPITGIISNVIGGGVVVVHVDGIPVGTYPFDVDAFTGTFSGNNLDFHFEASIPVIIFDFTASFDFSGSK
jgi:hypothetical protein